jgi:hypothetical protein
VAKLIQGVGGGSMVPLERSCSIFDYDCKSFEKDIYMGIKEGRLFKKK